MFAKTYQDINKETIDRWVEEGWMWGKSTSHEEYLEAKQGNWNVLLTPTVCVPHEWFGDLKGKKILGLASGGGQQMPIFHALGAECTVLDYSSKQIESELLAAEREGYHINAIEGDMTKKLPFSDESFDVVFHPVSNCYVEDVDNEALLFYTFSFEQPIRNDTDGTKDIHDVPDNCAHGQLYKGGASPQLHAVDDYVPHRSAGKADGRTAF